MSAAPRAGPRWSTSSFDARSDSSPIDSCALVEHVALCRSLGGRWFGLRCTAEAARAFVGAHVVSTLAVLTLLATTAAIVW